jgi:hypothetical protein
MSRAERRGQPEGTYVTGRTGQADKKGRTGLAEQDWQNRLSRQADRTGLSLQGCLFGFYCVEIKLI